MPLDSIGGSLSWLVGIWAVLLLVVLVAIGQSDATGNNDDLLVILNKLAQALLLFLLNWLRSLSWRLLLDIEASESQVSLHHGLSCHGLVLLLEGGEARLGGGESHVPIVRLHLEC